MSNLDHSPKDASPSEGTNAREGRPASLYGQLLDTIRSHIKSEAASVEAYQRISAGSGHPLIRLLAGLVLEDERKHHDLLLRMATSLADAARKHHPDDLISVEGPPDWCPTTAEISQMRDLAHEEEANVQELVQLARRHSGMLSGVISGLLEVMAMDSHKHQYILELALRLMQERRQVTVSLQEERSLLHEEFLSIDHELNAGNLDTGRVSKATAGVRRHVYVGEEWLYPRVDQARFAEHLAQASRLHGTVCRLLEAIEEDLESKAAIASVQQKAKKLLEALESLDRLEDFVLYPAVKASLSEADASKLFEQAACARPPQGWVCRAMRS